MRKIVLLIIYNYKLGWAISEYHPQILVFYTHCALIESFFFLLQDFFTSWAIVIHRLLPCFMWYIDTTQMTITKTFNMFECRSKLTSPYFLKLNECDFYL